jgi:hypothetical protein
MMKKIFIISALAILSNAQLQAQDEKEVLLFSQYQPMSTARAMALGGAMGSVGADFGALCINPASLAKYSKSEFMFTPTFRVASTNSNYNGNTNGDDKTKLAIDNIGFVFANRVTQKSGWKAHNIAIGMNRTANFNRNTVYSGINTKSSMVNQYAEVANAAGGLNALNDISLLSQMAYSMYLLDTVNGDANKLYSFVPYIGGLNQYKRVSENGGIHEFNLSLAANNNDQLLIGATLGIPIVHYSRTTNYEEEDKSGNTNNDFASWQYTEKLVTSGAGINLKVGAIYMPIPSIRFGVALHSPTYYSLSEEGNNSMSAKLEKFKPLISTEPDAWKSLSEYNLATPYKAIVSGSFVIGKLGFISADYEYLDYRTARISMNDVSYTNDVNAATKKLTMATNNIKLGAELRLQAYTLRAGYAMYGSQLNGSQINTSKKDISIGAGYRGESFFTDIAFVNSKFGDRDYLYQLQDPTYRINPASIANTINSFVFTLGWKY